MAGSPQEVFSDDWWGRARPIIELHGYFRTRAELLHTLYLGRHGSSVAGTDQQYLWPVPLDQSYTTVGGQIKNVGVCGPKGNQACNDKTQSGANMRLRIDPEIHISDNLRILTEVFALDNLLLGSTPNAYAMQPQQSSPSVAHTNGYQSAGYNPYAPTSFFSSTQGAPTAGVNSFNNSINVQRVCGEYMTPVGQVRFGRMPGHWGLGIIENSRNGLDSD